MWQYAVNKEANLLQKLKGQKVMGHVQITWFLAQMQLLGLIQSVLHLKNLKQDNVLSQKYSFWIRTQHKISIKRFTVYSPLKVKCTLFTLRHRLTIFQSNPPRLPKILHVSTLLKHRGVINHSTLKKKIKKTQNVALLVATNRIYAMRSLMIIKCQNMIFKMQLVWYKSSRTSLAKSQIIRREKKPCSIFMLDLLYLTNLSLKLNKKRKNWL